MKKIISFFALALALISCSDNIDTDTVVADFSDATVSKVMNNTWQTDDKIGIYMKDENLDFVTYANVPYVVGAAGATGSFSAVGTVIYYPVNGDKRAFYAYSPYDASITDYTYKVDVEDQSNPALIDLIESTAGDNFYSKDNSSVSFTFTHVLSKLIFTLVSGDGMSLADLETVTISIEGAYTQVDYDFQTQSFVEGTYADVSAIEPYTATLGVTYETIMIPTSSVDLVVSFTIAGQPYYWSPTEVLLESGKEHTYTVTISKTDIDVEPVELLGWEDGDEDGEDLEAPLVS
ncbi:MAG: fimbrillin family protein [Rikenellaceae bacterium]